MIPYSDLVDEILTESVGAPDMIIERMLRNASIAFFDETELWQERLQFIADANQSEYALTSGYGQSILKLSYCSYDGNELLQTVPHRQFERTGRPQWYFLREDKLQLRPASHIVEGKVIEVEVIFKPNRESTEIPAVYANKWFEVIQHGALARILSMPATPWYDPARASAYAQQYQYGIEEAIREGKRMNHSRIMTTRFNW